VGCVDDSKVQEVLHRVLVKLREQNFCNRISSEDQTGVITTRYFQASDRAEQRKGRGANRLT
jgi:hypothetical protein